MNGKPSFIQINSTFFTVEKLAFTLIFLVGNKKKKISLFVRMVETWGKVLTLPLLQDTALFYLPKGHFRVYLLLHFYAFVEAYVCWLYSFGMHWKPAIFFVFLGRALLAVIFALTNPRLLFSGVVLVVVVRFGDMIVGELEGGAMKKKRRLGILFIFGREVRGGQIILNIVLLWFLVGDKIHFFGR